MWTSTQIPHIVKVAMTLSTGISESKIRVIAPRVGGGFGSKLQVYGEELTRTPIVSVGGPCLATELARGLPTAGVWAATTLETARDAGQPFDSEARSLPGSSKPGLPCLVGSSCTWPHT